MSELTLESIDRLLESKFEEKLDPIKTELFAIRQTVNNHTTSLDAIQDVVASHTTSLDAIAKSVKDLTEEMKVSNRRAEKHEQAIKFTAEKVGIVDEVQKIIQS